MARSKNPRGKSLKQLKVEYEALLSFAISFREELLKQIHVLVSEKNIKLGFPIESRVKSWESISSKIRRLSLNLRSVKQLQDLVGVRLIVLFRRDLDTLSELISDVFAVVAREDTSSRLGVDQFGYQSSHFLVKLPESWLAVPTLSPLRDMVAEVQVRTVSQHMWAAASHVLQYKNEANVPPPVR